MVDADDLAEAMGQVFDTAVTPLADTLTRLLMILADKKIIEKRQAIAIVATSVQTINGLNYSPAVRDQGAELLMRMIRTIDEHVDPNDPVLPDLIGRAG